MKLKEKHKLLMDNDRIKEIKGSVLFKVPGVDLEFFVHESEAPWRIDKADITEKSTGLRLCISSIDISKITIEEAIKEAIKCIKLNTKKELMKKIDSTIKLEERI